MRRLRWIILIIELVMLGLVLVIPPVDLPQTAFNEADTPINEATVPAVLSCRAALTELRAAASAGISLIHPRPISYPASANVDRPAPSRSRPSLALLCTFLC
ncbi:MAG TPA: hypothetical protein VKT29_00660 [Terriglobales bacterium]|nr:hypothetical protein [Terriglobales bacterium]